MLSPELDYQNRLTWARLNLEEWERYHGTAKTKRHNEESQSENSDLQRVVRRANTGRTQIP